MVYQCIFTTFRYYVNTSYNYALFWYDIVFFPICKHFSCIVQRSRQKKPLKSNKNCLKKLFLNNKNWGGRERSTCYLFYLALYQHISRVRRSWKLVRIHSDFRKEITPALLILVHLNIVQHCPKKNNIWILNSPRTSFPVSWYNLLLNLPKWK